MKYCVLVLHGPLQSWGGATQVTPNASSPRPTNDMPTLSGVSGILRAAQGLPRTVDDPDTANARIVVRGDRLGSVARDFSVATRTHHGFVAGHAVVTPKLALQDATFVVLIGHDDPQVVDRWGQALSNPVFAPYLGRRAYVPSLPVFAGFVTTTDPVGVLSHGLPVFWGTELGDKKRVPIVDTHPTPNTPTLTTWTTTPGQPHPAHKNYHPKTLHRTWHPHTRPQHTGNTTTQYAALTKTLHTLDTTTTPPLQ